MVFPPFEKTAKSLGRLSPTAYHERLGISTPNKAQGRLDSGRKVYYNGPVETVDTTTIPEGTAPMETKLQPQENTRLFNRYFITTWLISLFVLLGQLMLNNAVSVYVDTLGYGSKFTGIMAVPFAVLAIFARFAGGYLCDSRSRRLVMAASCVIFCISAYLFGALPMAWSLILFRGLHGLGFGAANTSSSTASVDVMPKSRTAEGIGYFWGAQAIANGGAGYIVIALVSGTDYSRVFNAAAVFLAVAAALSLSCDYEKKPAYRPEAQQQSTATGFAKYFEKRSLPAAAVMFLVCCGTSFTGIFTMLFAVSRGYTTGGAFFLLCAVGMFASNVLVSRISAKIGNLATMIPAAAFFDLSLLLMVWTDSQALFLMAGLAYGMVQGLVFPVLNTLAVEQLPFDRRGVGAGTLFVAMDVGVGFGSFVWGWLIDLAGFAATVTAAAALSCLSIPAALLFFGRRKRA